MNGQELYELYVKANEHFCQPESTWNELQEIDRQVWEHFATLLEQPSPDRSLN